jgi:hypothetical protein
VREPELEGHDPVEGQDGDAVRTRRHEGHGQILSHRVRQATRDTVREPPGWSP